MKAIILCLLLFAFSASAQMPGIEGPWKLESLSRNEGSLVAYNAVKDQAAGYPIVEWLFDENQLFIYGDLSVPATDPNAQDTVEAHYYKISGDTLILTQFYTKGLELAIITNSLKAYYKIESVTADKMVLIYYDRGYDGSFRTIDKYSRRCVYSKLYFDD